MLLFIYNRHDAQFCSQHIAELEFVMLLYAALSHDCTNRILASSFSRIEWLARQKSLLHQVFLGGLPTKY